MDQMGWPKPPLKAQTENGVKCWPRPRNGWSNIENEYRIMKTILEEKTTTSMHVFEKMSQKTECDIPL